MLIRTLIIFTLILPVLLFANKQARAQSVVIENFIGFDCEFSYLKQSLVEDMVKNHDAFFLTCHVDMRSDDKYEQRACSHKKARYGVRDLYTGSQTPYSVFNGLYKTLGFHDGIHKSALALARKENALTQIPMTFKDNTLIAEMPALSTDAPMDLWFYAYEFESDPATLGSDSTSEGEDMTTRFVNMVTKMDKIGVWEGRAETISIPTNGFKADGFALIAQDKDSGQMRAIARIEPGMISQQSRPLN